jgi:GDP-D-mannose dehydratase
MTKLGWRPTVSFEDLVVMMVEADLSWLSSPRAHTDLAVSFPV